MIRNYLKIAFRNLVRNQLYSSINIIGLSTGVACCLLLSFYVKEELSYDLHHNRADEIYRVTSQMSNAQGKGSLLATGSPPIVFTLYDEIPEIEIAARLLDPPSIDVTLIQFEDKSFYQTGGHIADSTFFDIFKYKFLEGNPETALDHPNTVVLSNSLAKKIFGNVSALNQHISLTMGTDPSEFLITGVFDDKWSNSHIKMSSVTSMLSAGWGKYVNTLTNWLGQNFIYSYVRLKPGADPKRVVEKMEPVLQKHGGEYMKEIGLYKELGLEKIKDIHLRSDAKEALTGTKRGSMTYVIVISSIAVFILLIACINFMNLATAKAMKRAKEIGVRKVMGASKNKLAIQFLGESFMVVSIALLLSILWVELAMPYFNQLTGLDISLSNENLQFFAITLLGIAIFTTLLAGGYPAFYLSSYQPVHALKNKTGSNSLGQLRKVLVVVQFVVSITLISAIVIIMQQMKYIQNYNLGYDSSATIAIPLRTDEVIKSYTSLKSRLENSSLIKGVSGADFIPGTPIMDDFRFYLKGSNMENGVDIKKSYSDYGYVELMGIELLTGRYFTDNPEVEKTKVIINQKAMEEFGFNLENVLGQEIFEDFQFFDGETFSYEIIGVVKNYHQRSLHFEVRPTLFQLSYQQQTDPRYDYMLVSSSGGSITEFINEIEINWNDFETGIPLTYNFLDDVKENQYLTDQRTSKIISTFTFIAILISCLGLYGLSSYVAERRLKEIGIRKVLGAKISEILVLVAKDFTLLILIALIISIPIGWKVMQMWLVSFSYRIEIQLQYFIYAGLIALFIAWGTVFYQSYKAATSNPANILKDE